MNLLRRCLLLLPALPALTMGQSLTFQPSPATPGVESTVLRHNVVRRLMVDRDTLTQEIPEVVSTLNTRIGRREMLGIAAGGVMIVSGIAAAYYKDQANKQFDEYAASGNPASLDATHSLDAKSNVAYIATQLSFIFLSYILISE